MNSDRRLQVNADPLKVVEHRAGEPAPDRPFLWCERRRKGVLKAASIHRPGCRQAPENGQERSDSSFWWTRELPRDEANAAWQKTEQRYIEVSVSCGSCGGYSALP